MSSGEPLIPAGCADSSECLKEYGQLHYIPSIGGNAFFLALFIIAIIAQIGLGVKFRTWGYMSALLGGCLLEVVGYVGRVMLWDDIFNNNSFIIYLVGLTIGPAFFSAAIYLSLSRILAIYGETLSILRPRVITSIFIGCDLLSLILQAAGGAIASTADTQSSNDMGVNLMLAGLSTQVAATAIFAIVCAHIMWAIRKYPHKVKQETTQFRREWRCRSFMWAVGVATFCILVRCAFRCAELSEGFDSELANDEPLFMILDGTAMIITVGLLTAAHPGLTLGDRWNDGAFFNKKKNFYELTPKEASGSGNSSAERGLASETRMV